jgi:hypothetical protein
MAFMDFVNETLFPSFLQRPSLQPYHHLEDESEKSSETDSFIAGSTKRQRSRIQRILAVLPWLTTILFCILSIVLGIKLRSISHGPSFVNGWETELGQYRRSVQHYMPPSSLTSLDLPGPALSAIKLERVTFTGSPSYLPNGQVYVPNPGPIKYVGDPTPEMDAAWDALTAGRNITCSI